MKDPEIIWETWREAMGYSQSPLAYEDERIDQVVLEMFIKRMGNAILFCKDSSDCILHGEFLKLDPTNYNVKAVVSDGKYILPAKFIKEYIEESYEGNESADVKALCEGKDYSFASDDRTGLFIVYPKSVRSLSRETDPKFFDRMYRVFHEPFLPRPQYNNTPATRQIIEESYFPQGHVMYFHKPHVNLYTPSVLSVEKNGKTRIYLSYEHNLNQDWQEKSCDTLVKVSDDHGKTYRDLCVIPNLRWAGLFEVNGTVYLHGSRIEPCHAVVIVKLSDDGGFETLTIPAMDGKERKEVTMDECPWTQANPAIVANERIYLPTFPCVMSAKIQNNLMDIDSWEYSDNMKEIIPYEWLLQELNIDSLPCYWPLEASIVLSPDGQLYVTVRLEMFPYNGYMALLKLTPDGKTLTRDERCNGLIEMPTSVSKVDIKYDPTTKLYIGLPNYPSMNVPRIQGGPPMAGQRNILCLAVSENLVDWKMIDILLTEREVITPVYSTRAHAYQYVEWIFDGDDILMAVREANGYTNVYHDGTLMTTYRVKNYRDLIASRIDKTEIYHRMNIKIEK